MDEQDLDWLGDLRWRGYPRLKSESETFPSTEPAPRASPAPDPRLGELARENETLRSRLEAMGRLAAEFERRLSEAGASYEGAVLEAESRLREAALERQHLAGALEAAKAEGARLSARDAAREADLTLERERRAEAEKGLLVLRRKADDLELETQRLRGEAAGAAGALAELRRQASGQNERLLQAKALTDEDVRLLRAEMKEFLAKFHRIQDSFGEKS
ncbi:MAG: hypothetical protein ACHQ2Z_16520 [Elusimicrobiota bacterium]